MSAVPDAWEDDWTNNADDATPTDSSAPKRISSKVTKAQRRAQQAEFNRQLWAEAEGPKETNYFLESRNVVPLRSDFKPPPILLSRKGPIVQSVRPSTDGIATLMIKDESSEDEEEVKAKELTLEERQARAAKEREEKQRKYEERRQELFGAASSAAPTSRSGNSSPVSLTPPHSRSATPNRGVNRGKGRRGGSSLNHTQHKQPNRDQNPDRERRLFDPSYTNKPESAVLSRQESAPLPLNDVKPIRTPKGPDGSGRGGFGFAQRGGRIGLSSTISSPDSQEWSKTALWQNTGQENVP